jgi:hypothetical protein
MLKRIFTSIMSTLLVLSMFCIPTAYASEPETTQPSPAEIINEISKFETPYFGIEAMDFDLNGDESVDVFDLVLLKRKVINGDEGVTVATLVKLQSWLLGKPNSTLQITTQPTPWYDKPSNFATNIFKNLTSNDFKFVRASEGVVISSDGKYHPAVTLYFLGCDEYTISSVFIYNFCYSVNDLDEVIGETDGFVIGLKNNAYTLATKTEIPTTKPEENPSETTEPDTTNQPEEPEEPELSPAYVKYDLRMNPYDWSTQRVRDTVWDLSTLLKAEPYTFKVNPYTSDSKNTTVNTVQLFGETGLATIEIIVEEREPVMDTPIFANDDFYLYYSNKEGFGICFSK